MLRAFGSRTQQVIEAHIREVLVELRPLLHMEPAHLELMHYELTTGLAVIRVDGDCSDCGMSASMLIEGIATHLRQRVPEIRDVRHDTP
jgi:Fe-S cluster biogenesis protein NfuA